MLKPPNEPEAAPDNDRPVGQLVHELIEDGKAYARAEFEVVKAIATAKANALKVPAILFGVAFLLALAAITALAVGVTMATCDFNRPACWRNCRIPAVRGRCRRPRLVRREAAA